MLLSQCATKRLSKVRCGENCQREKDNMLTMHQDWVLELLPTLDIIGIPILTTFFVTMSKVCVEVEEDAMTLREERRGPAPWTP